MSAFVHAGTSFLRSRSQFVNLVNQIHEISKDRILVYALSANTPDLERSVKQLGACAKETIGTLSGLIQPPGENPQPSEPHFTCSVAVLDREYCRPFSTLKTGEGPLQVGRWHSFRKKEDSQTDTALDSGNQISWEDVWNANQKSLSLPPELQRAKDPAAILYFCDSSSWEFARALHAHLPRAYQLGVSASWTPFVTGLPCTLLHNGKPQSSGAVGVAMNVKPTKEVFHYSGLVQLTRSLPVRRAEGNLIHALGESLPARILLNAIEERGLPKEQSKEAEYYIGLRNATENISIPLKMHRIIAGDPSRGSIAVEDVAAPPIGSLVEFYYRPKSAINSLPPGLFQPAPGGQRDVMFSAFIDGAESESRADVGDFTTASDDSVNYLDEFLISTENGFIYGGDRGKDIREPWKCTVPGAFGGLHFPKA